MSKNKFMKKLLIAGLCAVTATTMIGATACKDDTPNNGDEHVHKYATTWSSDKDGHWYACLNAGHTEAYTKIKHVDANSDNKCDECEYVMTTGGGNEDPEPGPGPEVTYASEKLKINANDLTAIADGAELVAGSGIYSTGGLTVTGNEKTILYNGEEIAITKRIQTNGTGKIDTKSLKFEIANDNSVIVLYAISGGAAERSLFLKDSEGTDIETQSVGNGSYVSTIVFNVATAGTYYVGSTSSGINLYHISVWEGGVLEETTAETKEAADATCTTPGNAAYTKTNFGRYKDGSNNIVTFDKLIKPALNHDYELSTITTLPTETTVGSVKVLCKNDHEHDFDAELPVLTSDKYTKVTEGQEAGKAYYGYAVPGTTLTATFVTDDVATKETTYTDVYTNDFTSGTVGTDATVEAVNGGKIYAVDADATEGYTAEITNGAYHASGAKAYVTLENTITSGSVKITGNMTCATKSGSWTYFQILAEDGTEFIGLRTVDKNGTQQVRVDGVLVGETNVYDTATGFDFEILVDLDNKAVTFKIGTTVLVTNAPTTKGVNLSSIMLNVNAGRDVYLNSITIATADVE